MAFASSCLSLFKSWNVIGGMGLERKCMIGLNREMVVFDWSNILLFQSCYSAVFASNENQFNHLRL